MLSGNKYLAQANDNRVRDITIQAPRGDVVDRNGTVLVDNRVGNAIQIQPNKLPARGPERGIEAPKDSPVCWWPNESRES